MSVTRLPVSYDALKSLCQRYHVRKLAVFGSALGNAFTSRSDVDVLVEFEPGRAPGFAFFELQDELSDLFGRRVDLNTPGFLSPYFRDQVRAEAQVLYERKR